jgi:hypothetical protein
MKPRELKRVLDSLEEHELDLDINITIRMSEFSEGLLYDKPTVSIPLSCISIEDDMIEIQAEAKDAKELSL